jgi:hypothetical protein
MRPVSGRGAKTIAARRAFFLTGTAHGVCLLRWRERTVPARRAIRLHYAHPNHDGKQVPQASAVSTTRLVSGTILTGQAPHSLLLQMFNDGIFARSDDFARRAGLPLVSVFLRLSTALILRPCRRAKPGGRDGECVGSQGRCLDAGGPGAANAVPGYRLPRPFGARDGVSRGFSPQRPSEGSRSAMFLGSWLRHFVRP